MKPFGIRRARPAETDTLSEIAFTSKQFWGYPPEWMNLWRSVLTLNPESVQEHPTYVAQHRGHLVGFYQLLLMSPAQLEHLWVLPRWIRHGAGEQLFRHACQVGREYGLSSFRIHADPNACGFYQKMGAEMLGYEDSSVLGHPRRLPWLEMQLQGR
jgi:GNAT superfamily N-acetyltransferase